MQTVQYIPLDDLYPHSDNPRLVVRDDVIDSIVVQLKDSGSFDPAHSLLVRPLEGGYQILSGHHRYEAAKEIGLTEIPCWVRELSDEDAYMQLILSNMQGELSPLEIGVHVLGVVELSGGGRGKDGGLSEYARQIGKSQNYVSELRKGAEVLSVVEGIAQAIGLIDKAKHLYEISKAPRDVWELLVEKLIEKSVNQVSDVVKEINKYNIPDKWQRINLPLYDIIFSFIGTKKPTCKDVDELVVELENLEQLIHSHANTFGEDFSFSVFGFSTWLKSGIGTYSWDINKIREYRRNVIAEVQELSKPTDPEPELGEWWQLGQHLLYCGDSSDSEFIEELPSASFAFADPPYTSTDEEWDQVFKWKHDYLIDYAAVVAVTPGISAVATFFARDTNMPYVWSMAAWIANGMTRGALGFGNWMYIALFSEENIHQNAQDFMKVSIQTGENKKTEHKGRKPSQIVENLMGMFTQPGEVVIDPFLGSGTTLYVAEKLGRVCVGAEISPEFCKDIIINWQEMTGQNGIKV